MSDFTDEEESDSIPHYAIQRNIYFTRLRNMALECQQRKQASLREKSAILRRKNEDILAKAREARMRQQTLESVAGAHMLMRFSKATERRMRHLDEIRERARNLRRFEKERLGLRKTSNMNNFDHSKVEQNVGKQNDRIVCFPYDDDKVRTVQRAIRRQNLRKVIQNLEKSHFILAILEKQVSFPQAVCMVRTKGCNIADLENLLRCLRLPPLGNGYSWFLYAIVLLSDFHDSLQGHFGTHPGFNVNVSPNSGENAVSVHLPILLYHSAVRLFCLLEQITTQHLEDIFQPFSSSRLRLARAWRTYHYFFAVYKQNHRNALRKIAGQALDIASTHQRILALRTGHKETGIAMFFERSLVSLNIWRNPSSWATIGIDPEQLCSEIRQISAKSEKGPYEISYDPTQLHGLSSCVTIQQGEMSFSIPPNVPVLTWRQFWFLKFREPKSPSLRSGRGAYAISTTEVSGDEMMELRRKTLRKTRSPELTLKQSEAKLRSVFDGYLEFCEHIGDTDEFRKVGQNYNELYSLYQIETIANKQLTEKYFRPLLLLTVELLQFAGVERSQMKALLDADFSLESFAYDLVVVCESLETTLFVKWMHWCRPRNHQQFILFENTYQLTGIQCRANLGTDFPHLRFGLFYHFVYKNSRVGFDPLLIISATALGPRLAQSVRCNNAKAFFRAVFVHYFTSDMHLLMRAKNQKTKEIALFSLVETQINSLSAKVRKYLLGSWMCALLNLLQKKADKLVHILEHPDLDGLPSLRLSHFQQNYLTESIGKMALDSPLRLFTSKMQAAFLHGVGANFAKNFRHFAPELEELQREITNFTHSFYELYHPLLNWIHMDLGSPSADFA